MRVSDRIFEELKKLPEPLQAEVLDFVQNLALEMERKGPIKNESDRKLLFQGFDVAGDVDAIKANFVPISGDMKAGATTVQHRGGRHDRQFPANWTPRALR